VSDPNGSFPHNADAALLLIDVINDLDFPQGDALLEQALPMARRLADFKKRARKNSLPAIYVNDNFGQWRSDFRTVVKHCIDPSSRGSPIAKLLRPDDDDYFVLKPKHSGFYSTSLDVLLVYLGVDTLILAGIAANNCVLFTANDAYMRDFTLYVPEDCVASNTPEETSYALSQMHKVLKADIRDSAEIDLAKISGIEKAKRESHEKRRMPTKRRILGTLSQPHN
jgi:nicotinamidase-related amidase